MMDHDNDDMSEAIPDLEFQKLKDRIGFVDTRTAAPVLSMLLPRLLLDRPCGEGAVPPNLLDEWDKSVRNKRASIAYRYSNGGYGIDAYIIQLRMQIANSVKMVNGFHEHIMNKFCDGRSTACSQIWELAHHEFCRDPEADIKVKGCILYLLNGKQDVTEIPQNQNTMDGLKHLAANLAYPLMFERHETSLIRRDTACAKGPARGPLTYESFTIPTEKLSIVHSWDGTISLGEQLAPLLEINVAHRFPELADPPGSSFIMPWFNKPLVIPVRYQCNKELAKTPTFNDMRSFRLSGLVARPSVGSPRHEEANYHICAVVNLENDDVRLYDMRTAPLVEYGPPDREDAGQRRDNGHWSVGDRETRFLLWYRRSNVAEGNVYRPPIMDAPEFISAEDFDKRNLCPGSKPPFKPKSNDPLELMEVSDWEESEQDSAVP